MVIYLSPISTSLALNRKHRSAWRCLDTLASHWGGSSQHQVPGQRTKITWWNPTFLGAGSLRLIQDIPRSKAPERLSPSPTEKVPAHVLPNHAAIEVLWKYCSGEILATKSCTTLVFGNGWPEPNVSPMHFGRQIYGSLQETVPWTHGKLRPSNWVLELLAGSERLTKLLLWHPLYFWVLSPFGQTKTLKMYCQAQPTSRVFETAPKFNLEATLSLQLIHVDIEDLPCVSMCGPLSQGTHEFPRHGLPEVTTSTGLIGCCIARGWAASRGAPYHQQKWPLNQQKLGKRWFIII